MVVGAPDDPHVAVVTRRLPAAGTVVVDAESLPNVPLDLSPDRTVLRDLAGGDAVLGAEGSCRGWIRRYAPAGWGEGAPLGGHRAAVMAARMGLLGAILREPAVAWHTTPDRIASAENKIVQYRAATTLGLRVPPTAVGPSAAALADRVGEPFVLKPIGPGNYTDQDGTQRAVFVRPVKAAGLAGVDLLEAPFLAQTLVCASSPLRIVTMNESAWAAQINARGLPVDWRAARNAHRGFDAIEAPDAEAGAVAVAGMLDVGFSSQDWIADEQGRLWFLDLNPGGQWQFLPASVSESGADALAQWVGAGHE